jgi:hypothetical protein
MAHATHVFAAEVVSREHGTFRPCCDRKGRFSTASPFSPDLAKHLRPGFEPRELLPVHEGRVVYAPGPAACEEFPAADFEVMVRRGAGE